MRLLFAATGSHGHVLPLLPLAAAARQKGHDVAFATSETLLPTIREAGLEPVLAGLEPAEAYGRATSHSPDSLPPEETVKVFAAVFGEILPRAAYTDVSRQLEHDRADLVVFERGNIGAGLAAVQAGVPVIAHTYGRVNSDPVTDAVSDLADAVAADLGVARPAGPVIDIYPDSLQAPEFIAETERIALRPTGWSDSAELPSILSDRDRSRPLVYLTLSTVELFDAALLRRAIDGVAALPVDVLVSSGTAAPEHLEGLPDNVHLQDWTPQSRVMPHSDLLVHHGGAGAMLNAFRAGVPQLVLQNPLADVQGIATTVNQTGAGAHLVQSEVTVDSVRETVARLLADEAVRAAAAGIAEEIAAMPSPEDVAGRLPSIADVASSTGRTSSPAIPPA